MKQLPRFWMIMLIGLTMLAGCGGHRQLARESRNICVLLENRTDWFRAADQAARRWKIPIPVMMAIMHQESKFNAKAKPPRTRCCLILPGPRPSSAYGYAQALTSTWEKYKSAVDNPGADRDDFADAIDFVGWYCHRSRIECGLAPTDAQRLYLAYHEGWNGFRRGTFTTKPWLQQVARKVERRAQLYTRQFKGCQSALRRGLKCFLWPF